MPSEDKKARERAILDLVYASRKLFAIDESERPDFLIRLMQGEKPFGVEVAEFFESASLARLRRIPGYVGQLLDGGPFRHRDDHRELVLGKVSVMSEAGEVKHSDVPAIIKQRPTPAACADKVAEIIRGKDQKLALPFDQLRHINLIIYDETNLLRPLDPSKFYRLFCTEALTQAIFGSRFREVYFVTEFSAGQAFIPLKMVVTLAHLYFLHSAVKVPELLAEMDSVHVFMQWFGSYLGAIVAGDVWIRRHHSGTEVLYGDTGFLVEPDLKPQLRMYFDSSFAESELVSPDLLLKLDPTIVDRMHCFLKENTFVTGVAFEVRSGAYFRG